MIIKAHACNICKRLRVPGDTGWWQSFAGQSYTGTLSISILAFAQVDADAELNLSHYGGRIHLCSQTCALKWITQRMDALAQPLAVKSPDALL